MYTVEILKPTEKASVHCANCVIYEERIKFAEAMEEYFGQTVVWDYVDCFQACERARKLQQHDCKHDRRG